MNLKIRLRRRWQKVFSSSPTLQYMSRWWSALPPSTRALPRHLFRAVKNFTDYGMRTAAALTYYAVFSVFPLTLLVAVVVSDVLGPTVAREQIAQALILFLPDETATINLVQANIEQALEQSGSFGLLALVGLSWSALGLFSNLTSALDRIFEVPASRSLWVQRFLAFLMTIVLILLIGMSFITSGVLQLVDTLFLSSPSVWIRIGTLFLPFGLNMVIFVMLFRYVPARHVNWDAVWPAAILGGIGLELAKAAFAWYLTNLANFQIVYGSIATVIVLMLWAYVTAGIFLVSAEICSQLNLWFARSVEPSRMQIMPDRSIANLPAEIPPPF